IGIKVREILSVADRHVAILEALGRASQSSNLVIMTGGLGPTKDDITKFALSCFYGVGMEFHQETYERLKAYFAMRGRAMDASLEAQCNMPSNAEILTNNLGTAPGMWFDSEGIIMVSMPGVPYEMRHIMETSVIPKLKANGSLGVVTHHTICTGGVGETDLARLVENTENNLPPWASLAYLPGVGQVRMRLSAYNITAEQSIIFEKIAKELEDKVAKHTYAIGDQSLEETLGKMLLAKGKTISVAESCTGGYIAHKIASIAGASEYFRGGVIPYHNDLKIQMLGVKPSTIEANGAVSEQTVREMVTGALALLKSDIAIAISGIAGPSGGSEEKPVGTTWIAIGDRQNTYTRKVNFSKDRLRNIEFDTAIALYLSLKFLQGQEFA
ncbi:MAG: CinA family nicotinamide mononucleotide deamidase-related protein, partial [Saprospiraceae bacterium]